MRRWSRALRILNAVVILALLAPWHLLPAPGVLPAQRVEAAEATPTASMATSTPSPTRTASPAAYATIPGGPAPTTSPTASTTATAPRATSTPSPTASPTPSSTATPAAATATASPAASPTPGTATATPSPTASPTAAALPAGTDRAEVDPARGGTLRSSGGKVEVRFGAGVAAEPLALTYRELKARPLPNRRMVRRFELEAFATRRGNAAVRRFAGPVEVTVRYTAQDVAGLNAASLRLSYYDEIARRWIDLPSRVDTARRTVQASLDHFTQLNMNGDPNVSAPGLIQQFQNDLHSGAATAEYPIDLPPGPGGFQPRLMLSYNSARVDEMRSGVATCSWVGCGWSLDLGRISYDDYYKRYTLQLGGMAYELLQDGAQGWHTKSEQYYHIRFDESAHSWAVWDRGGARYEFGGSEDSAQYYWSDDGGPIHKIYYRYDLKRMVDTHGNEITAGYVVDTRHQSFGGSDWYYPRAAYPAHVWYGQTHVELDVRSNYTDTVQGAVRRDDPRGDGAPLVMETRYLDGIRVYADQALVRRYQFAYTWTDGKDIGDIRSGYIRLVDVRQYGSDDATVLPAMGFQYADLSVRYTHDDGSTSSFTWPHLSSVQNGYGGGVEFGYADNKGGGTAPWSRQVVMTRTVSSGYETPRVTTFSYAGGPAYLLPVPPEGHDASWYGDAQYRGFAQVSVTDADANLAEHHYFTTYAGPGEEARFPSADGNAEIFTGREDWTTYHYRDAQQGQHTRVVSRVYDKRPIYGKINFVMLQRQDVWLDGRRSKSTYEYDAYGNTSWISDYDEADAVYRIAEQAYHPANTSYPTGIPSRVTTRAIQTCLQSGRWSLE